MKKKEVNQILKDYHWMINSIKIMRESLKDAGEGITAQYGIESSMPKAQGTNSDPVYSEVVRRTKRYKKIMEYEERILNFQGLFHKVYEERECEVLYWLLEGKSYRWIGEHMGLSASHIQRLRDNIIDRMSDTNVTNGTNDTDFSSAKRAC